MDNEFSTQGEVLAQTEQDAPDRSSRTGDGQSGQEDAAKIQAELARAQEEIAKLQEMRERDVSAVRSSLDQRHAREMADVRTQLKEYEDRMHNAAMQNMDEQEKIAYELEVERNRRARLEQELSQERQVREQTNQMNQYAQGFVELGVPYEELDFTDPNSLWTSGWEGTKKARAELLERVRKLETGETSTPAEQPKTTAPEAPKVMTQHGSQPSENRTIGDVIMALKAQYPETQWTEDKVVTQVERGQLPRSIIEGIDWSK